MRVLVAAGGSGGHVFPALAVLEELYREGGHCLGWIGAPKGLEARVAASRSWIEFFPLNSRGLPRKRPWAWPGAVFQDLRALAQAKRIIREFQPDVVLAMGGYPSVAPVLAAKALGIPVALHEQNAVMGLANRFLARFSDLVLLAFPHTQGCPRGARVRVTGTPVRRAITAIPESLGEKFLVLGGSLGSKTLVEAVVAMAPKLATIRDFRVHLVVGRAGDPKAARPKASGKRDLCGGPNLYGTGGRAASPSEVGSSKGWRVHRGGTGLRRKASDSRPLGRRGPWPPAEKCGVRKQRRWLPPCAREGAFFSGARGISGRTLG
jgi:UDP-N-acetylglucosamine:LPS N-acetylglucosamine transferase